MTKLIHTLAVFAFTLFAVAPRGQAQATGTSSQPASGTALVTFFADDFYLTGDMSGEQSDMFMRKLFVDHDKLALMPTATFVTIEFLPGHYQFTASPWMALGPKGGAHLDMDLTAGRHYFIETKANISVPFHKDFQMREVTCEEAGKQANQRAARDTLLYPGRRKKTGKHYVVAETAFPACPK